MNSTLRQPLPQTYSSIEGAVPHQHRKHHHHLNMHLGPTVACYGIGSGLVTKSSVMESTTWDFLGD